MRQPANGEADLRRRLAQAVSVPSAAGVVMEHCLSVGYELPSIYLERGGRLRCVAQRGYWQVYDGLPAGAGVLGTTYERGRTQVVDDIATHENYIRAVPQVRAEVCVPLRWLGRTIGVFNVESGRRLTGDDVSRMEQIGACFEHRLAELGGPPHEEPAEMLARFGFELACLPDADEIVARTLDAALTLSGMGSGCLFLGDSDQLTPCRPTGPLGDLLSGLPVPVLSQLAGHVSRATSSYASGIREGVGFEATQVLRDAGVGSLVVLALVAKGDRPGMIVLVDERPQPGLTRAIPLLELLASTSAAMICAAGTSAALHESQRRLSHQAQHDPLTGLANRSQLIAELSRQLADPGAERPPIVLFLDLDGFKEVNDEHGHQVGDRLLVAVADRLRGAARDTDLVARLGGDEFVVLCRRLGSAEGAAAVARRVSDRLSVPFDLVLDDDDHLQAAVTACIGIAAGTGDETVEELIAAAGRAMYQAKRSGPGTFSAADPATDLTGGRATSSMAPATTLP